MRRRRLRSRALLGAVFCSGTLLLSQGESSDLAAYVDPLIGTWPPGFVNPGPVLPHGMVGLGPDTEGPLNYGGYYVVNSLVTGFSHTHMSAGVPQAGQIPIMPVIGAVTLGDLGPPGYPNPLPPMLLRSRISARKPKRATTRSRCSAMGSRRSSRRRSEPASIVTPSPPTAPLPS